MDPLIELIFAVPVAFLAGLILGALMEASFHHKLPWNRRS